MCYSLRGLTLISHGVLLEVFEGGQENNHKILEKMVWNLCRGEYRICLFLKKKK